MNSIDLGQLPKHFEAKRAEEHWAKQWDSWGIYDWDDTQSRGNTFVIDTPPPTVSGSLHVGHVFSYTHTDIEARYQRMLGKSVFYPIGWDDNGLPTERRVQNYYHVRCDIRESYRPNASVEAFQESDRHSPPRKISRPNFIELCLKLTAEDEKAFKSLWRRVGLSVDWRQEYSTIDDRCRRIAQISFLDLYQKGYIYNAETPTAWDVDFQTAVAQAEIEDRQVSGHYCYLRFGLEGTKESFVVATTRPELLPACVGVTAHPQDERYRHLFGRRAITPLFQIPVPIFPSEIADPEKGSGVLMVCTFGDAADVRWWREQRLPLRQIIGRDGRLLPISFGAEGWESKDPSLANYFYSKLAWRNIRQARKAILEVLSEIGAARSSEGPLAELKPITHFVKFFEKGDQPLEFISTRQWFVRLLDKKEKLIEMGERIVWYPDFMRLRYRNWTENLQFDWCISRQRYYGVAFPLWYSLDDGGQRNFEQPIVARPDMLPVDPLTLTPSEYKESQRDRPGGFTAESDVLDTWFTSSLTPQIGTRWETDPRIHDKLFPMDLRPQSHDIIRTWAFYTIVKSLLHENSIPWKKVAISGWVLDPDRKKMSKSRGNVVTPIHLLDEYGADAVRYWSANARLGTDTIFDQQVFKVGRRLVTKLFNAAKFVLLQTAISYPPSYPLDFAFLGQLRQTVERATNAMEQLDHAAALNEIERFFWRGFTDNYVELVKLRVRYNEQDVGRGSAVATLRLALKTFLRMLAPFLPYVTEEIWSWSFAGEESIRSVHLARWPQQIDIPKGEGGELFDAAVACISVVNRRKSGSNVSIGRAINLLELACNPSTANKIRRVMPDLLGAVRARDCKVEERQDLEENVFEVLSAEFGEGPS